MNDASAFRTRGTIIKVPDTAPGILIVNGEQKPFQLENIWKSPVAPAVNMAVEVEIDAAGSVAAVSTIDSQQVARERLDQISGAAQQQGKQAANLARQGVGALAVRMGKITLGAAIVLWIAWFFLPAATLDLGFMGSKSFTFWDFLGIDLNNLMTLATVNHGFFSMIGVAAIAAPFAAPFVKHSRANLLNAAPLAYLVIAGLKFRWDIVHVFGQAQESFGAGNAEMANFASEMSQAAIKSAMDAVSVGLGTYLVVIAALVLAAMAFKARAQA